MRGTQRQFCLIAVGALLLVFWFACWAATVVPGSPAETTQWAAGNVLAFLAGAAFGAAVATRSDERTTGRSDDV
jgi:membrane associated rhomboid family serine protease